MGSADNFRMVIFSCCTYLVMTDLGPGDLRCMTHRLHPDAGTERHPDPSLASFCTPRTNRSSMGTY